MYMFMCVYVFVSSLFGMDTTASFWFLPVIGINMADVNPSFYCSHL